METKLRKNSNSECRQIRISEEIEKLYQTWGDECFMTQSALTRLNELRSELSLLISKSESKGVYS